MVQVHSGEAEVAGSTPLDVRPEKIPIFSKNGKIVILVKIRNFSRFQMTKRTSPLKSSREI